MLNTYSMSTYQSHLASDIHFIQRTSALCVRNSDVPRYSVDTANDVTEPSPITFTTPTPIASTPSLTTPSLPTTGSGPAVPSPNKKGASSTRNRGIIFPNVKNKPAPANTTFTTDQIAPTFKDVKVCYVPTTYINPEISYMHNANHVIQDYYDGSQNPLC